MQFTPAHLKATCALGLASAVITALPCAVPKAAALEPRDVALRTAQALKGAPYRWGATGPLAFDCSGLTQYAYRKAGKKLPRTAAAQFAFTQPITVQHRKPGDLVFFPRHGVIGHVALYAGNGYIWHAPKPGGHVRRERLWTERVAYHTVR
ncbi:C40 family peptidase [Streptomyces sp. ET3-23]|nr:C40 family peptidase [Streptomyces sp. ET3-23]